MSLVKVADALKSAQNRGIDARQACHAHKIADSFMKIADEACPDQYGKGVCATLINNFAKIMDSDLGEAFTHSSDFGPYVMEVWPLVTAWYPDFPLKDLISVQDMDKPLAYMFFSLLKVGKTKGNQVAGNVVETALGRRTLKGQYPTGEVFGEHIPNAQFSSGVTILGYAPLNVATTPGYLDKTQVTIDTKVYKAYNVVNGEVLFKLNGTEQDASVIKIDVATGTLTIATGTLSTHDVVVNYVWDLDFAETDNIQTVKEQVEMRPMEAIPRAIMLEWTIFSEYLKKSQFGKDIREDNTKRIMNLLYQFQVRYILDEMHDYAEGVAEGNRGSVANYTTNAGYATVTIPNSNTFSLEVASQKVLEALKDIASSIEKESGRMEGNRLVVGQSFKNWLESLPNTLFQIKKNDSSAFMGPREIGAYGTFTVYYDQELANDEGWMTYRGAEFYDAAYYLGEYMPIVPTDAIALAVKVRSSFVSMEAYRYDKKNCVQKIKFVRA